MSLLHAFLATRTSSASEHAFADWCLFAARHAVEPGTLASFLIAWRQVQNRQQKTEHGPQRPFWRKGEAHG